MSIALPSFSDERNICEYRGSRQGIQKAIEAFHPSEQFPCRTTALVGETEAFEDILKNVIQADNGQLTTSFIQLVAETIYTSGALDQLGEVEKLDTHDIEGPIHAYYNIISQPCMVCRESSNGKLSCRYTSLHSIPLDESLKIVHDYLIAATAEDCSLMISFRPKEIFS
ncbi:hypothetical protein V6N13_011761 [Hibiscus sabdariffa]|uniref:Inositol-pentakisphosphate 2-kinase n=1 Tax=Hibiscus sabdariffa TaxID=183260 RepID=A0ABR2SDL0_9ROSI